MKTLNFWWKTNYLRSQPTTLETIVWNWALIYRIIYFYLIKSEVCVGPTKKSGSVRPQDHLLRQTDGPDLQEGVGIEDRNFFAAANKDVVVVVDRDWEDLSLDVRVDGLADIAADADVTDGDFVDVDDPDSLVAHNVDDPVGVVAVLFRLPVIKMTRPF